MKLRTFALCLSFLFIGASDTLAGRQKVIDFEGDLVEGVNKRPLDSLSQISDANRKRKKSHLYRKRKGFRAETRETLREMRYLE